MKKLSTLWLVIRSHNFILMSDKGYRAITPRFGHARYWKESRTLFDSMKKFADRKNEES